MFPERFKHRILDQKYIDAEILYKALEEPSPVSIRINPSKWNRVPLKSEIVPWCKTGFYLDSRPSYTLDPLFHAGCFYPQEASSMFLEQVIMQIAGSTENIRVLDLCGAPGGKTTHMSDLLGTGSLLISNDVIRSRSLILAETVTKWGSANTLVTQNDPSRFGLLTDYFDIILVDAPCSGEGMFRNITAISEWSEDNTIHCSERQKRILFDVWPALKENGILIYSTCTFNPGENEENIRWFIGKHEAECERINISAIDGIEEIDYHGIYGYGFYPGKIRGEGFFISVIRKTGKQEPNKTWSQKKLNLIPDRNDLKISGDWAKFSEDRLIKWGSELFAVPCDLESYIYLFQNLRIVKGGTKIFNEKNNNYLPSHELALSQQIRRDAFPKEEIDLQGALSYLRRDNFILPDAIKGWNIITYKGINLGLAKKLADRVNNYYPVEWRIRMNIAEPGHENCIIWNTNNI